MDIMTQISLTLSTIVGTRISSPSSSGCFGSLLPCCGAHHFEGFSYACALQAMALFGLNFERFPAMIGMLTFLVSSVFQILRIFRKLTRTPSARAPCSSPSGRLTPEMPSTFSFSKLSYSMSITSGNT